MTKEQAKKLEDATFDLILRILEKENPDSHELGALSGLTSLMHDLRYCVDAE
jgi:hypothetical protein